VRAVALGAELPPRVIGLAWHRDRELPPAAGEFAAIAEGVCEELSHQAAASAGRSSSA
jgi:hypothetical protein